VYVVDDLDNEGADAQPVWTLTHGDGRSLVRLDDRQRMPQHAS